MGCSKSSQKTFYLDYDISFTFPEILKFKVFTFVINPKNIPLYCQIKFKNNIF